jgi:hypothetical protein
LIADVLKSTKLANQSARDKLLKEVINKQFDIVNDLWLVGSDSVISAFAEWSRQQRADMPAVEMFQMLTKILMQMRRDLGNNETDVNPRDMFTPFIMDIDIYFPPQSG